MVLYQIMQQHPIMERSFVVHLKPVIEYVNHDLHSMEIDVFYLMDQQVHEETQMEIVVLVD